MSIEFVGSISGTVNDGGNVTLDLTALTGGIDTAARENDIVLAFGAVPSNTAGINWSGYTLIDEDVNSASTGRSALYHKFMSSTPDTSAVFTGDALSGSSVGALAMVFRYVNLADPFAATATVVTGASTDPNPPSITADAPEAATVVFAFSRVGDPSITVPSNYDGLTTRNAIGDTDDVSLASAWRGGMRNGIAEAPPAFGTWLTGSWRAISVALNPSMPRIQYVGSASGAAINGGDVTIDLTALIGGIASAAAAGDVVIVSGGSQDAADAGVSTSGYTEVVDHIFSMQQSVSWKLMGGTPDTSVVGVGSGSGLDGVSYVAHVFRGVHSTVPMDAAPTLATGSSSAPDSPSITTVTDGAIVISAVVHGQTSAGTLRYPMHFTKDAGSFISDNTCSTAVSSFRTQRVAAAVDPAAWASFGNSAVWCAATIALRPVELPVGTLDVTLAALTLSSAVSLGVTGGTSSTLEGLSGDSDAALAIGGELAKTLDGLTLISEGETADLLPIECTVAVLLENVVLISDVSVAYNAITGILNQTLQDCVLRASMYDPIRRRAETGRTRYVRPMYNRLGLH